MASGPENGDGIDTGPPTSGYTIVTTAPDRLLRHDISDEELDMLCETRRDNVWEGLWIATGTCAGGIPSTIPALWNYIFGTGALPGSDLLQILVFSVAGALAAVLALIVRNRSRRASQLQTEIRERTIRTR